MSLNTFCSRCNYDLKKYKITFNQTDVKEDFIRVQCPVCGQVIDWPLDDLGLIRLKQDGNDVLRQWRLSGSHTLENRTNVIFVGGSNSRFQIRFPKNTLKDISVNEVCFSAIPVFELLQERGGEKEIKAPDLPIKPEYIDLVDFERQKEASAPRISGDKYKVELFLKGVNQSKEIILPLIPASNKAAAGRDNCYKGVSLVFWPNIDYKLWKRYFLHCCLNKEGATLLFDEDRKMDLQYRDSSKIWNSFTENNYSFTNKDSGETIESSDFGVCTEDRPQYVSTIIRNDNNAELGGGIFIIKPATKEAYPRTALDIAVDFGTSNTCVAYRYTSNLGDGETNGQPEMLPFDDLTGFIVKGDELPTDLNRPHMWIPRKGFGRHHFLPSELLFSKPTDSLVVDQNTNFLPIENFTIPTSGCQMKYSEREYIASKFKWAESVPGDMSYIELQKSYLGLLLLIASAQLANKEKLSGSNISIKYSFPLVFTDEHKEYLHQVFQHVTKELVDWIGADTKPEEMLVGLEHVPNETIAAGKNVGTTLDNDSFYVDIGGGSTDIALVENPDKDNTRWWRTMTSIRYAGTHLLDTLTKINCLKSSITPAILVRTIRETESISNIFRNPDFIVPGRGEVTQNKVFEYYLYLMEYLARIVAARVIEGNYNMLRDDNVYSASLYLLGNGWGLGEIINSNIRTIYSDRLQSRINKILDDVKEPLPEGYKKPPFPRVKITLQTLKRNDKPLHPKMAVAFGLLPDHNNVGSQGQPPADQPDPMVYTTISGCDFYITGERRNIPWYMPVSESFYNEPPLKEDNLTNSNLVDIPEDCLIDWPSKTDEALFKAPRELDKDLNNIRSVLRAECLPKNAERWIHRSPMETLLESLWLKKITNHF